MKRRKWTSEEDEIIRTNYPKFGDFVTQKLLPGRDIFSVRRRASKLGVKKADDISFPRRSKKIIRCNKN